MKLFHSDGFLRVTPVSSMTAGVRNLRIEVFGPQGGSWGRFFVAEHQLLKLADALRDGSPAFTLTASQHRLMASAVGDEFHLLVKPLSARTGWWGFTLDDQQLDELAEAASATPAAPALSALI